MEGWFWSGDRRFLEQKPLFTFKNQLNTPKTTIFGQNPAARAKNYRLSEVLAKMAPKIANDFLAIFAFPGPPPGKLSKISKKVKKWPFFDPLMRGKSP